VVNVSQTVGGQKIKGHVTSWQTRDGPYNVEHLAAASPNGDLLVFWWTPQRGDWQVVNVSALAGGQKIIGPLTSWQKTYTDANGPFNVEYVAGTTPGGNRAAFFWSPRANWQFRLGSHVTPGAVPVVIIETTDHSDPDTADPNACPEAQFDGRVTIVEDHNAIEGALNLTELLKRPAVVRNLDMDIKVRGFSSASWSKKSYTLDLKALKQNPSYVRLLDGTTLLGMPAGRKWVLHSCYKDPTCLGNVLTYSLASGMMQYAPRTRFVELFMNGKYRGLYVLIEKIEIDTARVNLPAGGFLFDRDTKPTGWTWQSKFPNPREGAVGHTDPSEPGSSAKWTVDYPEPPDCRTELNSERDFAGGDLTREQKEFLQKRMDEFESRIINKAAGGEWWNKPPAAGYRSLIDARSWVDYTLLQEFTYNYDGYYKSWYGTYANGLFRMGPVWDFDFAYANRCYSGGCPSFDNMLYPDRPNWEFRKLWLDPWFAGELGYRWRYLSDPRNPLQVLSLDAIKSKIDGWKEFTQHAVRRDQETWKNAPDRLPSSAYARPYEDLKDMLGKRFEFLNARMPASPERIVFPNP
jgi:CotH protein